MKFYRNSLRLLISASSVLALFGGWAMFAHTPKPAPIQAAAPINTPAPLDFKSLQPSGNLQPLPVFPQTSSVVVPRLRTRGS